MSEKELIIVEISKLSDSIEEFDLDDYCQFMKEMILSTSGLN